MATKLTQANIAVLQTIIDHSAADFSVMMSGIRYIKGDGSQEGDTRLRKEVTDTVIEVRDADSIWQPGSFRAGAGTIWVGHNVGLAGVGHHFATESADGHLHFHAHSEFDGETTPELDARMLSAPLFVPGVTYQPDFSGEWTGTFLAHTIPAPDHILIVKTIFKIGSTAATSPVRVRCWAGTDDTGMMVFDQTYGASMYVPNTDVDFYFHGYMEFERGQTYYMQYESSNPFSLKTDVTNSVPYIAADTSFLREDTMLQTAPFVDGDAYTKDQWLVRDRKILVCNTTGVQTGTFEDNAALWDLLTTTGVDFWETANGEISPVGDENIRLVPNSKIWMGERVALSPIGYHLASETAGGDMHFYARSQFDYATGLSLGEATMPYAYGYQTTVLQPDFSGEFTGTGFSFNITPPAHYIIRRIHIKTGATAATQPVTVRIYEGSDANGLLVQERTHAASVFIANSDVTLEYPTFVEFLDSKEYHVEYSSPADFSVLHNGGSPFSTYLSIDASILREDSLFQTEQWVAGKMYYENGLLVHDRKIYKCNQNGVQNTFFESNLSKWDELASLGDLSGHHHDSHLVFGNSKVRLTAQPNLTAHTELESIQFEYWSDELWEWIPTGINAGMEGIEVGDMRIVPYGAYVAFQTHYDRKSVPVCIEYDNDFLGGTEVKFKEGTLRTTLQIQNDTSADSGDSLFTWYGTAALGGLFHSFTLKTGGVEPGDAVELYIYKGHKDRADFDPTSKADLILCAQIPAAEWDVYNREFTIQFEAGLELEVGEEWSGFLYSSGDVFNLRCAAATVTNPYPPYDELHHPFLHVNVTHQYVRKIPNYLDGGEIPLPEVDMQSNMIRNLAAPALDSDAAHKLYVDDEIGIADAALRLYVDNHAGDGTAHLWGRAGTVVSPVNTGDDISTTGDIIADSGNVIAYGKQGTPTDFIAGFKAGNSLSSSEGYNALIGYKAGQNISSGESTVLVGAEAGGILTDESNNTFIGAAAGGNSHSDQSTFLGYQAGYNETDDFKLHIANNSTQSLLEGNFVDKWLKLHGTLEVGIHGVLDGKITFYDSGSHSERPEIFTNSSGDLVLQAHANGADIILDVDANGGDFWIKNQAATTLMWMNGLTGEALFPGEISVGVATANPHKINIVTSAGGQLAKALLLCTDNAGVGAATGITFKTTSDFQAYSKGGIYFECTGEGWGAGQMHFCVNPNLSTSDVALGHSQMKINRTGEVGIGLVGDNATSALHVRSSADGSIVEALRLQNANATADSGTALLFSLANSPLSYAKAGILFEGDGTGYSRGAMHFAVDNDGDQTDVTLANSKMKITRLGDVEIAQDLTIAGSLILSAFSINADSSNTEGLSILNSGTGDVEISLQAGDANDRWSLFVDQSESNEFKIWNELTGDIVTFESGGAAIIHGPVVARGGFYVGQSAVTNARMVLYSSGASSAHPVIEALADGSLLHQVFRDGADLLFDIGTATGTFTIRDDQNADLLVMTDQGNCTIGGGTGSSAILHVNGTTKLNGTLVTGQTSIVSTGSGKGLQIFRSTANDEGIHVVNTSTGNAAIVLGSGPAADEWTLSPDQTDSNTFKLSHATNGDVISVAEDGTITCGDIVADSLLISCALPSIKIDCTGDDDTELEFAAGGSNYTMGIDNSDDAFVITPGTDLGAAAPDMHIKYGVVTFGSTGGASKYNFIENDALTSTAGITVYNLGAGDAVMHFGIPGDNWSAGIDNSDSDKFKISHSTALETSTALTFDVSLNATLAGDLDIIDGNLSVISPYSSNTAFVVTADSLVAGGLAHFHSNSSSSTSRKLMQVINSHSGATGAIPLYVSNIAGPLGIYLEGCDLDINQGNIDVVQGNIDVTTGDISIGGGTMHLSDAHLNFSGTTSTFTVPRLTTGQVSALSEVDGMIVYNTTLNKFQAREGNGWYNIT